MEKNNVKTKIKFTRGSGLLENLLSKKRAKLAEKFIRKSCRSGRILDIGCGKFPFFLASLKFNEKYGLDFQEPIKSAEFNLQKFNISQNSALPYRADFFDVVSALAVIEHLNPGDIQNLMLEISRVLKAGGRVILTTPSPIGDKILRLMAKFNLVSKEEIKEHKKAYFLDELKRIAEKTGLKVIDAGTFEMFMNNYLCAEKPLNFQ